MYTFETAHFRINYPKGYESTAKEAGEQFEHLYTVYSKTYKFVLPTKTEILILDAEVTNGFAFTNANFITIWPHDFDINLRGTHEWLRGVCAHEFGHIMSISTSLKYFPWIPYLQLGYFEHPNQPVQTDAINGVSSDILPNWFAEGIAQFEDSRSGTDSWDTHRDMLLRTNTISHHLLSWNHMSVFTGTWPEMEGVYNHGFSLIRYISDTYGYDKVVTMCREASKVYHVSFDAVIKEVLGISGEQLYKDWVHAQEVKYKAQLEKIGKQVYGRKLSKEGFDNIWPRFSPDEKKIFFVGSGKSEYTVLGKNLYSYSLIDTVKEDKRIKPEMGDINESYSIHAASGLITFASMKDRRSELPFSKGGEGNRTYDVFIDTLPREKPEFNPFKKKTERMVTKQLSVFSSSFSPKGDKLVLAKRIRDRFYLCIADTNGKNMKFVYPDSLDKSKDIQYIYSSDWSSDGHSIVISYIDHFNRKIGIYDTLTHAFKTLTNSDHDERDPRFSADGKQVYFSSDRTGIFNIYRYDFATHTLERLTNVSGGAFNPDISKNGRKLVYSNYDENGFHIYLMDSLQALEKLPGDSTWAPRDSFPESPITTAFSASKPYSHIPRQFLCIPTLIAEQAVTDEHDPFKGETAVKLGAIFNLFDPLGFNGFGNEVGGYFLFEASKFFEPVTLDPPRLNAQMNCDIGAFGSTDILPVNLSTEYMFRGITGVDQFFDAYNGVLVNLPYQVQLHDFDIIATKKLLDGMKMHAIFGYNAYNILLLLKQAYNDTVPDFGYPLSNGVQGGLMWTYLAHPRDSRFNISPRGLYAKVEYDYIGEHSLDSANEFNQNGLPNLNPYRLHQVLANVKFGMSNPLWKMHDLYFDLKGISMIPADRPSQGVPSFYYPAAQVPGYAYYDTMDVVKIVPHTYSAPDTLYQKQDTLVCTGRNVLTGSFSYRFPLWEVRNRFVDKGDKPLSIDHTLLFIYFDRIYGALNVSAGTGFYKPSDLYTLTRNDILVSYGAELRLEAISFNSFPMALEFRWDHGADRPAPIGGDRFLFSLGFSFDDDWESQIDIPDYLRPGKFGQ